MSESCGTCRFSTEDERQPGLLLCRRRPPQQMGATAAWPKVSPEAWCGEYEAAERPTRKPRPTAGEKETA